MEPDNLPELPKRSRIKVIPHGRDGLLIYLPIPVRGAILGVTAVFSTYLGAKFLAMMAFGQGRDGAPPPSTMFWTTVAGLLAGIVVVALILNWIWPHLKSSWFCRVNILVEPGRTAITWVGPKQEKCDLAFDESQQPHARQAVSGRRFLVKAVEICGTQRAATFAESCSDEERDWLVETINTVIKRQPRPVIAKPDRVPARRSVALATLQRATVSPNATFDPYETADSSPVVIDEHLSDTLRFHFAVHREAFYSIVGAIFLLITIGALSVFVITVAAHRWKAAANPGEFAKTVLIVGIVILISSLPGVAGLWLLLDRASVTLTHADLVWRRSVWFIRRTWVVPVQQIEAITMLAFAEQTVVDQIRDGKQAPEAELLHSCVVRFGDRYLVLINDRQVEPVLRSLLRGKLAEWGCQLQEN